MFRLVHVRAQKTIENRYGKFGVLMREEKSA